MRRVKKYKAIQFELRMEDFTNEDVGNKLNRSRDYVAQHFRMKNGKSFQLEEAYAILDMLGIPKEKIFEYFPPGGEPAYQPVLRERRDVI